MRLIPITLALATMLIGCGLAQYQDGPYEANPNSYTRGGYEPNEGYSRPSNYPRSNGNSYPKSNRQKEVIPTSKSEEEAAAEEEKKPSALDLLLANSKFTCSNKKDGYYADNSVNCQVFHYCVGGAKHSWMCPEGTVFHQVHLNCVPAAQDICSQSEKYHIVNEYLHKPIEQNYGPNQTVRYHQRYYPEEFLGDPLASTQGGIQSYPPQGAPIRSSSYGSPRPSSYANNAAYEDENSAAYRAAPSYPPPQAPTRSPPKSSYNSYPAYNSQPKIASEAPYKVVPKKVASYGYSAPVPSSSSRSRPAPNYDSYEDNSFKPSSYSSGSPSNYGSSTHSSAPTSSYPSTRNSYRSAAPYQPYSAASASSQPAYKPTMSAYRAPSPKPSYNAYQGYQGSSGSNANSYSSGNSRSSNNYESNGNNKPYDYSGVTYEEDY